MPIARRDWMQTALAAVALPGVSEYFENWLVWAAPEAAHHGYEPPPEPPFLNQYQPKFFSSEEFAAIESFCEILIPTDELPGAREARCALYIDYVLAAAAEFAPERQRQWREALDVLRQSGFMNADAQSRRTLVAEMSRPETAPDAHHPAYPAYRLIKSENAFAFYSSRAGLIENLDYKGNTYNAVFPACDHPEHQSA